MRIAFRNIESQLGRRENPPSHKSQRHRGLVYLRQNKLCAQVWDTYDNIVEACKQAWHFLINDPDRIRSIGTRDWARVNV